MTKRGVSIRTFILQPVSRHTAPGYALRVAAAVLLLNAPERARSAGADEATPNQSVVKIFSTKRGPDLQRPWRKLDAQEVSGTGVVIEGQRILTNAHVVRYASRVRVQPDHSGDQITATVEAIAPDIDLAVLKLSEPGFFDKHPPLPRANGLPKISDTVHVAGYPQGGETLSTTRGIVSRIEFDDYYYGSFGVRVQIDAAVNPGNSGGPTLVDGKMIGVVFSSLSQSQNISYIIPVEEIDLFLNDIKDGVYDGKPNLYDRLQNVQNDDLRAHLGLPDGTNGMLVIHPDSEEPSYPLKAHDVIVKIGDHEIDSAGKVAIEGGLRIYFEYFVQKLAKDGKVRLSILRGGKPLTVDAPVLTRGQHATLTPYLFNNFPSYLVWGPLVFTPATEDYLHQYESPGLASVWLLHFARQQNPLLTRFAVRPAFEGEQLVVLTTLLPHRLAQGYRDISSVVVKEVDGTKVRNIRHLAECLRDAKGEYVVISLYGEDAQLLVFNRREAVEAAEEIDSENGIRKPYSDDLKPVFEGKK